MIIRQAVLEDSRKIAMIHFLSEKGKVGFFSKMNIDFFNSYYSIILSCPTELVICAEYSDGIRGFAHMTLNYKYQMSYTKRYFMKLVIPLLKVIVANPSSCKIIFNRAFSSILKNKAGGFFSAGLVRGCYWGWHPAKKEPLAAIDLYNHQFKILKDRNIDRIDFEVDNDSTIIYQFHIMNGARVVSETLLRDGRKRFFMSYDTVSVTMNPKERKL